MLSFVFGFFHLLFFLWGASRLLHVAAGLSFCLYEYTVIMFFLLLLDVWVSSVELLCIMLLWTFLY